MMTQELILIRGLPGSGKSTLAYYIWNIWDDGHPDGGMHWLETDQFFQKGKEYIFKSELLHTAHMWCQEECRKHLKEGDDVIVSNTFTRIWEMKPYIDMAKEFGAKLTVITCEGQHGNVHNVPPEKIQEMKLRWEPYV